MRFAESTMSNRIKFCCAKHHVLLTSAVCKLNWTYELFFDIWKCIQQYLNLEYYALKCSITQSLR